MSWILVRADFDELPPDLSPYVDTFRDFGVENTLEDGCGLQGCVVELEGSDRVIEALKDALISQGVSTVTIEPYVEQDWEVAWRQFFKPRRVGQSVLVVPTWETVDSKPGDIVLRLDPGQAFGTGDHPTTRLCLELLEKNPVEVKTLIDVGCGSGILAIAAAKMGANVVAVDIDPVALEVARQNAATNEVSFRTYCGDGLQECMDLPSQTALREVPQDEKPLALLSPGPSESPAPFLETFDMVLSNIISATLIRLSPQLTSVLKPGGIWIVSGIIEDNWPEVEKTALSIGLTLQETLHEDGWVAASFMKL